MRQSTKTTFIVTRGFRAFLPCSQVINQSVIYDLLPEAWSRLTTNYMTTYFIGGAAGSAAGSQAYAHGGWAAAAVTVAVFPVLGLFAWLADGRHERARYNEIRTDGQSGYAPITDSR